MKDLNKHLKCFIEWKIINDENWRKVKVIFSGSDVPGEGEHKIMKFIRNNKGSPNRRHCIYGLDADLILLGLLTHEPYIIILREEVSIGSVRSLPPRKNVTDTPKFECLYINLIREYLALEFESIIGLDLERLIDDFVVLLLFIGNDFIPRLPTFEINEGAIDKLFGLYKNNWSTIGYLCNSGSINWPALETFFLEFPQYESKILTSRIKSTNKRKGDTPIIPTNKSMSIKEIVSQMKNETEEVKEDAPEEQKDSYATKTLKDTLNIHLERGIEHLKNYYYNTVLGINYSADNGVIREMVIKYLEGLQWVMNYYFQGVCDWQWYYPYHYAPMISDFVGISLYCREFEYKEPYFALEQLLVVIPPGSKSLLPREYSMLMEDSDLQMYFPKNPIIEYDPMCAKIGWESLKIKVPFVPFDLLIQKTRSITQNFENNIISKDILFEYNPREPTLFVRSTVPSLIPDFDCTISEVNQDYRDVMSIPSILAEGTLPQLAGFPSIHKVPFINELKVAGVSKFQSNSSNASIILNFNQSKIPLKQIYDSLIDKTYYFDYPHCVLGKIMGVSDQEGVLPKLTQKDLAYYEMTEIQYIQYIRSTVETNLLYSQGITIKPELGILVHYYPISSIKKTLKGKYVAEWKNYESIAPLELLMKDRILENSKDLISPSSLEEEFPIGSRVIITKKDKLGYQAEIVGYNNANIKVRIIKKPKGIISDALKLTNFHEEKYYSVREIAQMMHKPITLINKMMSSIKIKVKLPGKTKILEIGLNLKHDRDYLSVLRWARWGGYWLTSDDWEYSASALHVLKTYLETFPLLWREIEKCWNGGKRNFQLEDLFSYSKAPSREVERVALWVCKQPSHKEPWASLYSQYLCDSVVDNIGKLASSTQNELLNEIEILNPNHIFIPSKPWCPLFTDKILEYKLGNRVVNLNPNYHHYVPFGAEGTIVALLDSQHAEVLWDDIIIKSKRVVLPTIHLLNLTIPFIIIKRSNMEKMPYFRSKTYDDQTFKPEVFKKIPKDETPEDIITRALSDLKINDVKLNPLAEEFNFPEKIPDLQAPSGLEFPLPSFK